MKHQGTVTLETERLILQKFKLDDAPAIFQNWTSDEEVTKYLTWQTHKRLQDTQDYVKFCLESYQNTDSYRWVIIEKRSMEPIGDISVVSIETDVQAAELGWVISRKHWGKGYMPEAAKAVITYLLENIGFHRVFAVHDSENSQSGRVMEKVDMTYEGTLRQAAKNNRGIVDIAVYSILKDEVKSS